MFSICECDPQDVTILNQWVVFRHLNCGEGLGMLGKCQWGRASDFDPSKLGCHSHRERGLPFYLP